MRHRTFLWSLLLLVLAIMVACGDDEDEPDDGSSGGGLDTSNPFRIAMVADQTGPAASFNGSIALGAQAAVDYINEHGGILGRQVVMDIKDAATDPAKAADIGSQMILSKDYHAIYAATFGSPSVARQADQNKLLVFTAIGDPALQDPKQVLYAFDLASAPADQAMASACYIKTLPYKKIAVYQINQIYSQVVADTWRANLPKFGIEITGSESVQTGALDVSAQLIKLKAKNPEAIAVAAGATDLTPLLEGMANLNWSVPVIGESAMSSTNFEKVLQSLDIIPDGSTMSAWGINVRMEDGLTEGQQRAIDALKASEVNIEFPLYNYVYGWDVPLLIKWAAETAQSDSSEAMVKALETLDSVDDQSSLQTALVGHYPFTSTFHGLVNDRFTTAKPGKITDGLYEWGGKEYDFPCQ